MRTAAWCVFVIAVLSACDGASDPNSVEIPPSGPSFAQITMNGAPWVPETRAYFRNGDFLSFGFDRRVTGTPVSEGIGFFLPGFTGEGSYPLRGTADSSFYAGYGTVNSSTGTGGGILTTGADPGMLRITGFDPTDSTVAGTFHFLVDPDPSQLSGTLSFEGTFRVRPSEQLSAEGRRMP